MANSGEVLYDFFRPNLTQRRIDTLDDAIDTTFKLFNDVVVKQDGDSTQTLTQLLRETGKKAHSEQLAQLKSNHSIDFEVKQFLNLYTLTYTINNFFLECAQTRNKSNVEQS